MQFSRGLVLFVGSERCLLLHPDSPNHRWFLRFAFNGVAYQPYGLSLAPRTFTKCIDAALSPLRQMGVRILNYLDDWLTLVQSEDELIAHSHLEGLGLRINLAKSFLFPSQQTSFLKAVFESVHMRAVVVQDCAPAIQQLVSSFSCWSSYPLRAFQKMLGLMTSATPVLQLGLLRMRPFQYWLKPLIHLWFWFVASWKHLHQGETGLHSSPCPLEGPSVVRARREDGIGLHKEGCLDRYFQNRLGSFVRGQSDLRLLVESGRLATHQLPRNDSSMLSSSNLSAGPERTPRVIYESPR